MQSGGIDLLVLAAKVKKATNEESIFHGASFDLQIILT
jgi:hypothetical protein